MTLKILYGSTIIAIAAFFAFSIAPKPFRANESELNNEVALEKIMKVVTHKRCVNCHPSGNAPRQGEESRLHDFGIVRGSIDCKSCHQNENDDFAGVPGTSNWDLAPESMAWEGKSGLEILESILDTNRNGGKNHEELLEHLTEHELVLWGWNPGKTPMGEDREPVPVPLNEYIEAVKFWFENGAQLPEIKE